MSGDIGSLCKAMANEGIENSCVGCEEKSHSLSGIRISAKQQSAGKQQSSNI